MKNDKAVSEVFSIYPREISVIKRVRDRYGMNKSAALQFIINDWAADKGFSELSTLMGHSSVEVTQEYIEAAKASEKRKPRKVSPRKKLSSISGVTRGVKVS